MAIKADPAIRQIPVVVMSTSSAEADVSFALRCRREFIRREACAPSSGLVEAMRGLSHYWADLVQLPANEPVGRGLARS